MTPSREEQAARVRELATTGRTREQIAHAIGISRATVCRICSEFNITVRAPVYSGGPVSPVLPSIWDESEDIRRQANAQRAAKGARAALKAMEQARG